MKRLLTKQDREESRKYQFEYLLKNGYQKTEYKNVIIFSHPTEFTLKSFWGSAANHTDFIQFRDAARLQQKIDSIKSTADSREEWQAKQKERNKGLKSSHAAAAAAIRTELKANFPDIKFSVTSDSFAGGNSVSVSWTDGPTTSQVQKFTRKYQYGSFNGMEDIYEYTNSREDIPQTKYVQESRTMSESTKEQLSNKIANEWNIESLSDHEISRLIYQEFCQTDFCDKKEEPAPRQPTSTSPEKIQIVDYSEKAIAVIGNFSEHYTNLINLGGAYNSRLKCGRGIIFSKKKLEAVKAYFLEAKQKEGEEQPAEPKAEETTPPTDAKVLFSIKVA